MVLSDSPETTAAAISAAALGFFGVVGLSALVALFAPLAAAFFLFAAGFFPDFAFDALVFFEVSSVEEASAPVFFAVIQQSFK